MIQVRTAMFETNSSSCHALILLTEGEYGAWKRGEVFVQAPDKVFTPEQILEKMHEDPNYNGDYSEEEIMDYLGFLDAESYDMWQDDANDITLCWKNGVIAIMYERSC